MGGYRPSYRVIRGRAVVGVAALNQSPAVRVRTLGRPAGGDEEHDVYAGFRVARLAASSQVAPAPVVWVWRRSAAGGPVELLAAGTTALPPLTETSQLAPGELSQRVHSHPVWVPLTLRPEALLTERSVGGASSCAHTTPSRPGQRLEHALGALGSAFTVLVIAEPVPVGAVEQAVLALDARAIADGRERESRPGGEVAFQQWRWRLRELRSAQAQGAWVVRIVAGGADRVSATAVAGAVASGFDLHRMGYLLAPAGPTSDLATALAGAAPEPYATDHRRDWQLPDPSAGIVGSRVVAQLIRPPVVELPGIRVVTAPAR